MPDLVLGPVLRFVDRSRATVWVETDGPATVEVRTDPPSSSAGATDGPARATTFAVAGRHFAVVTVTGLAAGTDHTYEVLLDDVRRWPLDGAGLPPSLIRTAGADRPLRVVFGSCRVAVPHHPPHTLERTEHPEGHGVDALVAYGRRLLEEGPSDPPDHAVFLGDQVYGDLDPDEPEPDLERYMALYHRSWSEPTVRWVLSTVPSAMVFDDHDIVDDWNLSAAWLDDIVDQPWWDAHVIGGLTAYWLYQHLGNLHPDELATDPVLAALREPGTDGEAVLRAMIDRARLERAHPSPPRWSSTRDLLAAGTNARLVMADTRSHRRLEEGDRAIIDDAGWAWVDDRLTGDVDHLLIGASLPWLLPEGVHEAERWSDRVGAGRWGGVGRRIGERARRAGDLEHWAAFGRSFERLAESVAGVATGRRGHPPASVLVLSGDVHFSYVVPLEGGPGNGCRVVQLVSSPIRNGVPANLRRTLRVASSRLGALAGRLALAAVGAGGGRGDDAGGSPGAAGGAGWQVTGGPWFGNGIATLTLQGRRARVHFERSRLDHRGLPDLVTIHEERLC